MPSFVWPLTRNSMRRACGKDATEGPTFVWPMTAAHIADAIEPGEGPSLTEVSIPGGSVPTVAGQTIVLTKVTGTIWTVAGVQYPSSAIGGATQAVAATPGSVAVSVAAAAGYTITSTPTSWSLTVDEPSAATFADDFGSSAMNEATFLARATPVGGATVAKAGTGAVSVNASGYLVLNATAGVVAVDYTLGALTGVHGTVEVEIESLGAGSSFEMFTRKTATAGNSLRGRFRNTPSSDYAAQSQAASSTAWSSDSAHTFAAGDVLKLTSTSNTPDGYITTAQVNSGASVVHSRTGGNFASNGVLRLLAATGSVVTIRSITWTAAA